MLWKNLLRDSGFPRSQSRSEGEVELVEDSRRGQVYSIYPSALWVVVEVVKAGGVVVAGIVGIDRAAGC